MSADGGLLPPPTQLMTGSEPIGGTSASVQDFWAWTLSDLRGNTVRPMLAEFLVANALGAADRPRIEWEPYDVVTPEGITVEVKSSAYVQAWAQTRPSIISFGGAQRSDRRGKQLGVVGYVQRRCLRLRTRYGSRPRLVRPTGCSAVDVLGPATSDRRGHRSEEHGAVAR